MPYAQCPNCKSIFHLSVSDVQQWFRERHPTLTVMDLAPERCFGCLLDIKNGSLVSVLEHPIRGEAPLFSGKIGIVDDIQPDADGNTTYAVEELPLEGAPTWRGVFRRDELWCIPGQRDPRLPLARRRKTP
jgi:hypothetical protein